MNVRMKNEMIAALQSQNQRLQYYSDKLPIGDARIIDEIVQLNNIMQDMLKLLEDIDEEQELVI